MLESRRIQDRQPLIAQGDEAFRAQALQGPVHVDARHAKRLAHLRLRERKIAFIPRREAHQPRPQVPLADWASLRSARRPPTLASQSRTIDSLTSVTMSNV